MESERMNELEIFTDGACSGNPGAGGWGALLRMGSHEREIYGGEANTTNNRMELQAVLEALQCLQRPCRVTVYTDSQYVQKGITEWLAAWKRRGWKTASGSAVKNQDLWRALEAASREHEVCWRWVRGHAGHVENERADALARQGVDEIKAGLQGGHKADEKGSK